jgi:predicted TPR repeat methyltransferase
VSCGEKLLDIGIGTGLSSRNFADFGLQIYGLDISHDMLEACRSKGFASDLKFFDLQKKEPFPYDDCYFDHVICCGVLHFLDDLDFLFSDIERILKKSGILAFTIAPGNSEENYVREQTAWGIPICKHSSNYIEKLLSVKRLELLKEQRLLIKGADKKNHNMLFSVIICRKH